MLDVSKVASAIKNELGSVFSTNQHPEGALVRYVNSAVRYVCEFRNFTFNKFALQVTVTEGVTDYVIPEQIETFAFVDSELNEIQVMKFEQYYTTKDKSRCVGIWDTVLVCQTPGTYTLFYRGYPEPVTSVASGTVNVPESFYDAVVGMGVYYGLMDETDYVAAANRKKPIDGLLESKASRNTDNYPKQMKRMGRNYRG